MRLVFVNHLHPDEPLVGATRLREFALAMARRGHQVVVLTAVRDGGEGDSPEGLVGRLARHDWSRPLFAAARLQSWPVLDSLRRGGLPRPLRVAIIAGLYLGRGGVFPDWGDGAAPLLPVLAREFRPRATWGTFGNTEAWIIARHLARLAGCPWVMDVKDKWDTFIPGPLRGLLAWRFGDAAAMTSLAGSYLDHVRHRFTCPGAVVYSGVPASMLTACAEGGAEARLTLAGSTYSAATLDAVIEGIRAWAGPEVTFTYAGADHARVAEAARVLNCRLDIRRQVPLEELAALQRRSFANLYCCVGDHDRFHHKLFELLCADRPIICLPPDGPEAARIAARTGGDLTGCVGPAELAAALAAAWKRRCRSGNADRNRLAEFGWDGQAVILERVLATVVGEGV